MDFTDWVQVKEKTLYKHGVEHCSIKAVPRHSCAEESWLRLCSHSNGE